jgi:hypothetical protein
MPAHPTIVHPDEPRDLDLVQRKLRRLAMVRPLYEGFRRLVSLAHAPRGRRGD